MIIIMIMIILITTLFHYIASYTFIKIVHVFQVKAIFVLASHKMLLPPHIMDPCFYMSQKTQENQNSLICVFKITNNNQTVIIGYK